jgi:glycoprotein-N-acetylgalactosamine 3-beta-galactosyltransferase
LASNRTDPSLGTVNIPHDGPESLDNMWQKVRSIWSFVYDTYYDQ